jgi:CubicO group peptidase (beta-lactamase class C family)
MHRIIGASVMACLFVSLPVAANDGRLAGLDDFVRSVMKDSAVPGLAVVIVDQDRIMLAKGYGGLQRGGQHTVDSETLFGIASMTKAFTSAAMGILVDRGAVRLDDPLSAALPGFRLDDTYVSRHATIRDALAHRTGAASEDLLWYVNCKATPQELISRLSALPQQSSLRDQFIYNNLMYLVAGGVITQKGGKSWEEFISSELLQPIGMTRTSVHLADLNHLPNVATPYIRDGDEILPVPHYAYQSTAPSGAIYSSAADLGRWLRLLLNAGSIDGRRVVSSQYLAEATRPQMLVGQTGPADELLYPDAHFISYGLGWFVSDYDGYKALSHAGGVDGMASFIALLPERHFGVAVLENLESDMSRAAIRNWIFDRYLGRKDRDWRARHAAWMTRSRRLTAERLQIAQSARHLGTRPSLPPSGYVGRFRNRLLGSAQIRLDASGSLTCQIGELPPMPLTPWNYDSFSLSWPDKNLNTQGPTLLTFQLGADARPARFQLTGPMVSEETVYDADRE